MPALDYAVLCDHVRAEGGVAHIIAAGIEDIHGPAVPMGLNLGVVVAIEFTRNECGRAHRVELHLQDEDGEHLVEVQGVVTPEWNDQLPPGWNVRALVGLNFGVVFSRFGLYALEVLVDDRSEKSLRLRVVQTAEPDPSLDEPDAS